jgi:hypothetical protein
MPQRSAGTAIYYFNETEIVVRERKLCEDLVGTISIELVRAFAVIRRVAGLVAHAREEQQAPISRSLWHGAAGTIAYSGSAPGRKTPHG